MPGAAAGGYGETPVRVGKGELRFLGRMRVVDSDRLVQAAEMDAIAAVEQAGRGRCDRAERSWFEARAHQPRNGRWHDEHRPEVARAIAGCWVQEVTAHDLRTALLRARYWDSSVPEVQRLSAQAADTWWDEAHTARDQGAWSTAFARFEDVLSVAPHRSWARRHAEEARDHMLATQ